jgi:hypothetical protein
MSLTRRLFLRHTAVAGAAVASSIPPASAEPELTPRERLDAAIVELKAAANAIWPNADDWIVKIEAASTIPLFINNYDPSAPHATGGKRNG